MMRRFHNRICIGMRSGRMAISTRSTLRKCMIAERTEALEGNVSNLDGTSW